MIELIRDKKNWCSIVESTPQSDFYHTYDYHHLSKNEDEDPVLVVYREGETTVAIPLLFRRIPGTEWRDATSVYGYPGPLSCYGDTAFDCGQFQQELMEFLKWNKVVTVFSRLNPFVSGQKKILKGLGSISSPGKIVYLDLQKSEAQQVAQYNRRLRTYINKSRKTYQIAEARGKEEVKEFIRLYTHNMKRVNAEKRYFFDDAYFFDLLRSKDLQSKILLAKQRSDGDIVGGALFIKRKEIVQYHLSGARKDVLKLNPIKLLIDEMRQEAVREGFKYFNLGGGVGNKEDSLFRFKSGFSKDFKDFNLWKFVVNQQVYDELVARFKSDKYPGVRADCGDFFPFYRCGSI